MRTKQPLYIANKVKDDEFFTLYEDVAIFDKVRAQIDLETFPRRKMRYTGWALVFYGGEKIDCVFVGVQKLEIFDEKDKPLVTLSYQEDK